MKENVGIIALGQGGSNIVSNFVNEYETLFINTSKEDLSTIHADNKYLIPNAEGCNHSRDKAIGYVKEYHKVIIQQVGTIFASHEFIYLAFTAGGGTGSGTGPILLNLLSRAYPDKKFGAIVALPSIKESIKVQSNAYKCITEISDLQTVSNVFVLDNDKGDKFAINEEFAKLFNAYMELPKYVSSKGNIDIAELKEMMAVRGVCHITKVKTDRTVFSSIINSWERNDSVFVDMEKDKKVVYMGLSLAEETEVGNLTKYTGVPYDIFSNYNEEGINIAVLAGLSFPASRMSAMKDMIDTHKAVVKDSVENAKSNKVDYDLEFDIQVGTARPVEKIEDFADIFKKY